MKKSAIILLIPLLLISLTTFASAAFFMEQPISEGGTIGVLTYNMGLSYPVTWGEFIVAIVILLMLGFSFYDIISTLTMFSRLTSGIIAAGLAIIAVITRVVAAFTGWVLIFTAWMGVLSVFGSVVSAFVVWFLIHWGFSGIGKWLYRRKAYMEAFKTGTTITKGGKILKQVGEELK